MTRFAIYACALHRELSPSHHNIIPTGNIACFLIRPLLHLAFKSPQSVSQHSADRVVCPRLWTTIQETCSSHPSPSVVLLGRICVCRHSTMQPFPPLFYDHFHDKLIIPSDTTGKNANIRHKAINFYLGRDNRRSPF